MSLQVFDFKGRPVRTSGTHEAPLFRADDACEILGYSRTRDALRTLDQDEVEMVRVECADSKKRLVPYITESGLFSLIMSSKRPDAKAFKKWVTSEVLPAIRKHGFYDALRSAQEQQTERLLAECFPKIPSKSAPIFRALIAALLRLRRDNGSRNPPWARQLASMVYGWAIHLPGQQETRRRLNSKPSGSRVDHSMLSGPALESVMSIAHTGAAIAASASSWEDWKIRMEIAFGKKSIQLPMMVVMRELPGRSAQ